MRVSRNPEFRRSTAILLMMILMVFVIVLGGLMLFESQFKKSYIENNAAIVGMLLAKYPQIKDDIVPLITKGISEQEKAKGLSQLEQYGYQANLPLELLPSLNQTLTNLTAGCVVILCVFSGSLLYFHVRQYTEVYDRIREVTRFSEHVLEGNYHLRLPEMDEGDFSRLAYSFNRMRHAIQRNIEDLKKEKKFLVNLMSDISHQLKTPLAALMMYNDIMTERSLSKEQQTMFLDNSRQQLERMNWLIQSLLKLAKLDVGAIRFQKSMRSLNQTVQESVDILKGIAVQKGVWVVMHAEKELHMNHDRDWMEEALLNILKNAIEHTAKGDSVYVKLEESAVAYKIHIRDEGEGINRDEIPNIFKRFYRGTQNAKSGSIGIGLSLSKSIVEGHHGYIDVKSERGKGTVFTLVFQKKVSETM